MDRSKLYDYSDGDKFIGKSTKQIFEEIAKENVWTDEESVSGIGSTLIQTEEISIKLPQVFEQFQIKSIFDIPCGDFNWFQKLNFSSMNYFGGDIVQDIINQNNEKFKNDNINFLQFNIIEDNIDKHDLIFCRDCLVHFSYKDIFKTLENVKTSKSTYIMTTTFPEQNRNDDIQTGGWRPLNFETPPFNFPKPVYLLNEKCTEMNGVFKDKSLGLWRIDEIFNKKNRRNLI